MSTFPKVSPDNSILHVILLSKDILDSHGYNCGKYFYSRICVLVESLKLRKAKLQGNNQKQLSIIEQVAP